MTIELWQMLIGCCYALVQHFLVWTYYARIFIPLFRYSVIPLFHIFQYPATASCIFQYFATAAKHEAFSQMKEAKSLQLSLKAGLSSNNSAESVGCVGNSWENRVKVLVSYE